MQDIFVEFMIKKAPTPKTFLMKLGIIAAIVILVPVLFLLSVALGPFGFVTVFLAFGAVYGGVFLIGSMNIEYEYTLTNGEFDIDKIAARRRRKRLISFRCRDVEVIGKYISAEHEGKDYKTSIVACDSLEAPENGELWYLSFNHKDWGKTFVVVNANDKLLEAVKPFLSPPVMHRAFRAGS